MKFSLVESLNTFII